MAATFAGGLPRDHLFVNYGYEDESLARWLALKLTAHGYRVWFDQYQLLGGEPFPVDIDLAIKDRTFRMLSLLSVPAMNKPSPRKERQLAFNVGKALSIPDFVIPLKAAELAAEDLNWEVSDLTWIDFSENWAAGFRQLLRKLDQIRAPKFDESGPSAVAQWYASNEGVLANRPEKLLTNIVEFVEFPEVVHRVRAAGITPLDWPAAWPRVEEGLDVWAFEWPPFEGDVMATPYKWRETEGHEGTIIRRHVANLLRQYVVHRARVLGCLDGPNGSVYVPFGLLERNRWWFTTFTGKRTYKQLAADRSFGIGNGRRIRFRALQAFQPRIDLRSLLGRPSVRFSLEVYLTYPNGAPLEDKRAHSFRRRLSRNWFNAEWLSRLLAVLGFLTDNRSHLNLAIGPQARIVLAGAPVQLSSPQSINEQALGFEGELHVEPISIEEETA